MSVNPYRGRFIYARCKKVGVTVRQAICLRYIGMLQPERGRLISIYGRPIFNALQNTRLLKVAQGRCHLTRSGHKRLRSIAQAHQSTAHRRHIR